MISSLGTDDDDEMMMMMRYDKLSQKFWQKLGFAQWYSDLHTVKLSINQSTTVYTCDVVQTNSPCHFASLLLGSGLHKGLHPVNLE